jgi:hypothetical protein
MTNDFGAPGVPFDVLASTEPLLCVRFFLRFAIARELKKVVESSFRSLSFFVF